MALTLEQIGLALFTASIPVELGHTFAPILLAWSHAGLRQIVSRDPMTCLGWPLLAIIFVCCVPLQLSVGVYTAWNVYHYGMQHFGVLSLFKRCRSDDVRFKIALLCVVGTVVGMVALPSVLPRWAALSVTYLFAFSHWVTDLSLSSFVSSHWWLFLAAALGLGCLGFSLNVPRIDHVETYAIFWLIKTRLALGMAHFIYSSRIWKFSDPQVRAAIGRDLFSPRLASTGQ